MPTYSKIILTKSDVNTAIPSSEALSYGELAINYRDGKLYYKDYQDNVQILAYGDGVTDIASHIIDENNPHNVTATQLGVEEFVGLSPASLPLSDVAEAALDTKAIANNVYTKTEIDDRFDSASILELNALSVGPNEAPQGFGGLSYDDQGVFTYTPPNPNDMGAITFDELSVIEGSGETSSLTYDDITGTFIYVPPTLGTISTQDFDDVSITGGTISGVTLSGLSSPLSIAEGGTGATDASGVRSNMGLQIGVNIQGQSSTLDALSGLGAPLSNNLFITSTTNQGEFEYKKGQTVVDAIGIGLGGSLNIEGNLTSSNVNFTGGIIDGVTLSNVSLGSALPISEGGTGATDVVNARFNLGLPSNTVPSTTKVSSDYTITNTDRVILVNDDLNVDSPPPSFIDITLPSASAVGDGWAISIKKLGSSIDVRVLTTGGQTIDGDSIRLIKQKNKAFRVVSDGTQWCVMYPTPSTGWAYYKDLQYSSEASPPASLTLTTDVRTQLIIDGLGSTTDKNHLPDGVQDFWNATDNYIIGQKVGDTYDIRVSFDFTTSHQSESIKVELDIGDKINSPEQIIDIAEQSIQYSKSGDYSVVASLPIFTLDTFLANGGRIYLTSLTNNINITNPAIFIKRDFSPL
jgi:hypothetical protein